MKRQKVLANMILLLLLMAAAAYAEPVALNMEEIIASKEDLAHSEKLALQPLIVTKYHLSNKKFRASLKIVIISDFHDRLHQRKISEFVNRVAEYKPDLILMPGDIFEREGETIASPVTHAFTRTWRKFIAMPKASYDITNGRKLISELGKIAPIYISRGNHEIYYLPQDILAIVQSNATLLDNYDRTVTVKGMEIRIGGLSTIYDRTWLEEFSEKSGIKILLCHHPEYYIYIKGTKIDTFDLVVSGHAHGGQWRLFDRGVYAPGQGLFPKVTKGLQGKHLISTGISNSVAVRRIKNPREIVFLKIN